MHSDFFHINKNLEESSFKNIKAIALFLVSPSTILRRWKQNTFPRNDAISVILGIDFELWVDDIGFWFMILKLTNTGPVCRHLDTFGPVSKFRISAEKRSQQDSPNFQSPKIWK